MKCCFFQRVFFYLLLTISFLAGAQEGESQHLGQEAFAKCKFSILETAHLTLGKNSEGDDQRPSCSINLKSSIDLFLESWAPVFIFGPGLYEKDRNAYGIGFGQDKNGKWDFNGTDILLSSKMLKTSFTQEQYGSETLLVGYQLIRGNIAQGGPITVPGIRVLRITPKFVVSIELNFQPTHYEKQNKGYKKMREEISNELVEIVKSIDFEPVAAGPTVRSKVTH